MHEFEHDITSLSPSKNKSELIERATSDEWGISNGELIGKTIGEMLEPEIALARNEPNLWSLPHNAEIDLPGLDNNTLAAALEKWQELQQRYSNLHRFMNIYATSTENSLTRLKFDAHLDQLQRGNWSCYTFDLAGVHVPVKLDKTYGDFRINPKPKMLSDEVLEELSLALESAFGADPNRDEEESRREIRKTINGIRISEVAALNLLLNNPLAFSQFYTKEKMLITSPDRLMNDQEMVRWQAMINQLIRSRGAVVGIPGYGSYRKFEGIFQFGLGIALKTTDLNSDGSEEQVFGLSVPVAVRVGNKRFGWLICSTSSFPTLGQSYTRFEHGNDNVYWYEMSKNGTIKNDA